MIREIHKQHKTQFPSRNNSIIALFLAHITCSFKAPLCRKYINTHEHLHTVKLQTDPHLSDIIKAEETPSSVTLSLFGVTLRGEISEDQYSFSLEDLGIMNPELLVMNYKTYDTSDWFLYCALKDICIFYKVYVRSLLWGCMQDRIWFCHLFSVQ